MNLPQRKGAILRIKNVLHSFYRNFIGEFKLCSTRLRKARNVLNPTQLKEREKKKNNEDRKQPISLGLLC